MRRGYTTRELLILVAAVAAVFAAFSEFGLRAATAVVFVLGIALVIYACHTKSRMRQLAGIALIFPSTLLGILLLYIWMIFGAGPIYFQGKWPSKLNECVKLAGANARDVNINDLGSFIDHEYVWCLPVPPDKLDSIKGALDLSAVPANGVSQSFRDNFPRGWRPVLGSQSQYFSSPGFYADQRGPDGDHYFAMYDSGQNLLYVWHKSNF